MDKMSSTLFRKTYATLSHPTVVTVNGHPIGIWHPGFAGAATTEPIHIVREDTGSPQYKLDHQKERDAILRRINRRE